MNLQIIHFLMNKLNIVLLVSNCLYFTLESLLVQTFGAKLALDPLVLQMLKVINLLNRIFLVIH